MTSNQIAAENVRETKRTNVAKENETYRHNRRTEQQGEAKAFKDMTDAAKNLASTAVTAGLLNHPSWYNRFPGVMETTASLSFGAPYGTPILRDTELTNAFWTTFTAPDFAIVRYAPSIGRSENGSSPANIAAQRFYSFVRHANSGSRNYENSDLYVYLLAVSSMYAFVMEIKRAISACYTYSAENFALGRTFVRALGFDYDDMVENMPQLKKWLEIYVAKLQQFNIPSSWNLLARQAWMNSVVARDNDATFKSQLYAFKPAYYWQFTTKLSEGESGAGGLDCLAWHGSAIDGIKFKKVADIIDFGDSLLNAMYTDEDAGIISGDINKAYGNKIYILPTHFDPAPIPVISDQKTLEVFQNCNLIPTKYQRTSGRVYQKTGTHELIHVSRFNTPSGDQLGLVDKDRLMVTRIKNPDPGYVTSLATMIPVHSGYRVESCGTEVPTEVEFYRYSTTSGANASICNKGFTHVLSSMTPVEMDTVLTVIDTTTKYQYAPEIRWITRTVAADAPRITSTMDLDNYTVVSRSDLEAIHSNIILSLLSVF